MANLRRALEPGKTFHRRPGKALPALRNLLQVVLFLPIPPAIGTIRKHHNQELKAVPVLTMQPGKIRISNMPTPISMLVLILIVKDLVKDHLQIGSPRQDHRKTQDRFRPPRISPRDKTSRRCRVPPVDSINNHQRT